MVLVDTSVWIDHLRRSNRALVNLLDRAAVLCHPFIIGELACGSIRNRSEVMRLLQALPTGLTANQDEALFFLDREQLHSRGLGWIDIHLLASARLMDLPLWTLDKTLATAADGLQLAFDPGA